MTNNHSNPTSPETDKVHENIVYDDLDGLGAAIAISINEALGYKIDIPEILVGPGVNLSAFNIMRNKLLALSDIKKFEVDIFDYNLELNNRELAKSECDEVRKQHSTALRHGSALIIDEETQQSQWVSIPESYRQDFIENLDDVTVPEMLSMDEFIETTDRTQILQVSAPDILDIIAKKMEQKLSPLIDVIPDLSDMKEGKVDGITILPVFTSTGSVALTVSIHVIPNSFILKSINKKAKVMCDFLDELIKRPEQAIAQWCSEATKNISLSWGKTFAESSIAKRNTQLYNSLNLQNHNQEKKQPQKDTQKPTKREKRRLQQTARLAMQNDIKKSSEELSDIEPVTTVKDVEISLPWVNEGHSRQIEVKQLSSSKGITYIIDGIEESLQSIAKETLSKPEIAEKIESSIYHQAWVINGGNKPWEVGTVKLVKKSNKTPGNYRDESIWYTKNISNNAPRVYFVVKNAQDIETSTQKLQHDAKCLVVIGITDKSQQIDVLKCFTGKSHSELVANGAGSI